MDRLTHNICSSVLLEASSCQPHGVRARPIPWCLEIVPSNRQLTQTRSIYHHVYVTRSANVRRRGYRSHEPDPVQMFARDVPTLCCGRPSRIECQDDPHHRRRTAPARCIHHADNEAETCTTYLEHHILVSTSEQRNTHTGPLFPQSFSTNDMALCATPPEHETAQSTRIPQASVRNNIEAMSPNAGPLPSPACADDANNKWDNMSAADAPHPS